MFKLTVLLLATAAFHVLATPLKNDAISPSLLKVLKDEGSADIIVSFQETTAPILKQAQLQSFATRGDRINSISSSLQELTASSQKSVLAFLGTQNVTFKSFWISNKIFVKGTNAELIERLMGFEGVRRIRENKVTIAPLPQPSPVLEAKEIQWGVEMVEAPSAWEKGYTGKGVVVGILDTGVRYTHAALSENYRHNRGWLDVTGGGSMTPVDYSGHGTHVMGSIVGRRGVGVAPEAEWMACGATLSGYDEYLECGQFLLCPTHANGTEPDCAAAPHVVSHSWGKYTSEEDFLDDVILAWNAAGIIVVWAMGNEGSSCDTARYPAFTGIEMFAVGATDEEDNLAYFSSRGPGNVAGVIRPNIVAPGVAIVSADYQSDTGMTIMDGTSMATPHVAGVIALLLTNGTDFGYAQLNKAIFESASHTVPQTGGNCGGIPETEYPNHVVGYGRITAAGAIALLPESQK